MIDTGIGYAGLEGVWWLPACEPIYLPRYLAADLVNLGRAAFALLDAVTSLYQLDSRPRLNQWLDHKVPAHLRRRTGTGRVSSIRPDIQLEPLPGGRLRPVVTELEMCPSAHGFAHAMQVGYGVEPDLLQSFVRFLDGRMLLIAGTVQWSEFLFEQLAFCRALSMAGARAYVIYDQPVCHLAADVRSGKRWRIPMFGVRVKPADWQVDVVARLTKQGLERFLWPNPGQWPEEVGDAVVFRFGYVDLFDEEKLLLFDRWQAAGATFLNPPYFTLDTKVNMVALGVPSVRELIESDSPGSLATLDCCMPETLLLEGKHLARLVQEKDEWIVKYAGFDGGNQAWGGRSLQIGAEQSAGEWEATLGRLIDLPWPVVAQRVVPSLAVDVNYFDRANHVRRLENGRTRLRVFFLRDEQEVVGCGAHITVAIGGIGVSEGTDSVQAPVQFDVD